MFKRICPACQQKGVSGLLVMLCPVQCEYCGARVGRDPLRHLQLLSGLWVSFIVVMVAGISWLDFYGIVLAAAFWLAGKMVISFLIPLAVRQPAPISEESEWD